jgi:hypothetical protein
LKECLGVLSSEKIREVKRAWRVAFDSVNWDW